MLQALNVRWSREQLQLKYTIWLNTHYVNYVNY